MGKSKRRGGGKPVKSASDMDRPAKEAPRDPVKPPAAGMTRGRLAAVLAVTFAVAFGLAWALFAPRVAGQPRPPSPPPAKTIGEADASSFLTAVKEGDYPAMARIGGELFRPGDSIPDQERLFGEYAVNSFPPYQVYNFYSRSTEDAVYRVLLTVDENHKIDSFMAEEMPVVK